MAQQPTARYEPFEDRVALSLHARGLAGFGREKSIPVHAWTGALDPARSAVVARLLAQGEAGEAADDGRPLVEIGEDRVVLHPDYTARLPSADASKLGLPPATSFALSLDTQGLIHEASFVLRPRWVRPGGAPALVETNGALLRQDGQWRRIPEPLYSAQLIARTLEQPVDEAKRFAVLTRLGQCLDSARDGSDPIARAIETGGYLGSLRIHYASAFSLKLGSGDAFGFEPVLFGMKEGEAAADGEVLSEEADSLLPPRQQASFNSGQAFGRQGVKPAYALHDGAYVYIDPALRPALEVVQKYQRAAPAERRRFITNPRRIIAEEIGLQPGDAAERLFVETEQFSARISGVDIWRTAVLPWIKRKPNSWLPERFGLRIDDQEYEVEPGEVRELAESVTQAYDSGQPSVQFRDLQLPATQQAVEALSALSDLVGEHEGEHAGEGLVAGDEPAAAIQKLERRFLTVQENFEDAIYSRAASAKAEALPLALPASVKTKLKPHQVEGWHWLAQAHRAGLPGALLADDMGLGKTLQVLVFLAHLRASARAPVLIVAPTGLLANWEDEMRSHLTDDALGRIALAYGPSLKQFRSSSARDIDQGLSGLDVDAWRDCGVVLTTYETMRDYHFSFARLPFAAVVFDEIQKLKNPTSQQTRAAKALNGVFMIGMTGTPVENRLQDLWSIMDTVSPGLLGSSKAFEQSYPETNAAKLAELNKVLREPMGKIPPPMLRRMKDDHLKEMPEKRVRRERIPMPPEQARRYRLVVQRALAARGAMSSRDGMLSALHDMRAVSLHPHPPELAMAADDDALIAASARLQWTVRTLEDISKRGEKALVFLESLDLQERLAALFYRRFKMKAAPMRINGSVAGAKRQEMVRRFQSGGTGFDVMILSPRAGGVGLTLTAANHVIHLSRWWNPAVEDQSTDRVFRIGQSRPVTVYLPLAVHPDADLASLSFDIKLDEILERKRALSRDLLAANERGDADISELFDAVTGVGSVREEAPKPDAVVIDTAMRTEAPPRPKLTVSPTATASTPVLDWSRKTFEPGASRPLDDIFAPLRGLKLRRVLVTDPYAIAGGEARAALADVAGLICDIAKPAVFDIQYRSVDDMRDDWSGETDSRQRIEANSLLDQAIARRAKFNLVRKTRSHGTDFHDRSISAEWEGAPSNAPNRLVFDLGRGVIALRDKRLSCLVIRSLT